MTPTPEHLRPLILTLGLEAAAQAQFDALRNQHFPPERNVVPAHVTLFHSLPAAALPEVQDRLDALTEEPFPVYVTGLRFLGRGVAFVLESPHLSRIRNMLAGSWAQWLSPQDRQGFRPHITIQNKADPAVARALLESLKSTFQPFSVPARGLLVWRYLGGPWGFLRNLVFTPRT